MSRRRPGGHDLPPPDGDLTISSPRGRLRTSDSGPGPSVPPVPRPRRPLTLVEPVGAGHDDHGEHDLAVLTNRIAATLLHHDPGWRLPRPTALARHYNVSTSLVTAAVDELVARRLVRRLPDGQACRLSPAHYVLPLGAETGLRTFAAPLGSGLSLKSRSVSWSPLRENVRRTLRLRPGELACTVQLLWTVAAGEPAAVSTTHATKDVAEPVIAAAQRTGSISAILPLPAMRPTSQPASQPPSQPPSQSAGQDETNYGDSALLALRALHIEVQQPPAWAARSLALAACEHAVLITGSYDRLDTGLPAMLTFAAFRPEALRLTVATPDAPQANPGLAFSAWGSA